MFSGLSRLQPLKLSEMHYRVLRIKLLTSQVMCLVIKNDSSANAVNRTIETTSIQTR